MYFFDLEDYITTARAHYGQWSGTTIMEGAFYSAGWQGIIVGDINDYYGTARATRDAYYKALSDYCTESLDILNESTGGTITNLYYNDLQDAFNEYIVNSEIYFNALRIHKRRYEYNVLTGSFTGTYDEFCVYEYNLGFYDITTGTTTGYYNRPVLSGGTVPTLRTINYGDIDEVKLIDKHFNNHTTSIRKLLNLTKQFMVLIDNDTFEDF